MGHPLDDLDAETWATLRRWGFDAERFSDLVDRFLAGELTPDTAALRGSVEPPGDGDLTTLPEPGTTERAELAEQGRLALEAGAVGAIHLAGGMATRFGGAVKAAVPAVDGRSFLDWKLADAARVGAPVYLMTSFATHDAVSRLAAGSGYRRVETFHQGIGVRLTPDGELFRDPDGRPSLYAPGHGDLPEALDRAGIVERFVDQGGRVLLMSNIDNLGATIDAAILGCHLAGGRPITCEVVAKEPGDAGGAPARVDGHLQMVEGFRLPADFDQDRIAVFGTNTFWFDPAALEPAVPLTWSAVAKTVDGRPAVQFERIVNELTRFADTQYLVVERSGPGGRFQPVKDPDELERRRPAMAEILAAAGLR
jgi:UTP--glucose-1-phosphate uridylyltransferase